MFHHFVGHLNELQWSSFSDFSHRTLWRQLPFFYHHRLPGLEEDTEDEDKESISLDIILPVPTRNSSTDDINSDLDREFLAAQSMFYRLYFPPRIFFSRFAMNHLLLRIYLTDIPFYSLAYRLWYIQVSTYSNAAYLYGMFAYES